MERPIRYRLVAFACIAACALGVMAKEQPWIPWGRRRLDALLALTLVIGLAFWLHSKILEKRYRRETEAAKEKEAPD
jgi:hypothetical protein